MREGWTDTTLGEVAKRTVGRTPPRGDKSYWTDSDERPFCTIADMSGQHVQGGREGVTERAEREGKAKRISAGTLLLSFKLSIGRVGFAARDLFPNEAIAAIYPVEEVDQAFLALALEHVDWSEYGNPAVKGKTLNRESLDAVRLSLPPIEEQRRIVDLMSHVDAVVQATRSAHSAGSDSYSALSKPLSSRAGQSHSLEEVLLSARAGGTPSRSRPDFYGGDIPWVKSGEVRGTVVRTQESLTPAGVNGSSAWVVPAGRVLVAMYGATAGQVGMLGIDAATNQAVLALEADPKLIHPRYLYHLLRGDSARLKVAASGAAQPNLSKTTIIQRSYPIPSLNEQTTIAKALDGIEEQVERERITLEGLNTLRQVTLSALVSGEHAIPSSYDEFIRDEGAA